MIMIERKIERENQNREKLEMKYMARQEEERGSFQIEKGMEKKDREREDQNFKDLERKFEINCCTV
jgi:hypothetical protein